MHKINSKTLMYSLLSLLIALLILGNVYLIKTFDVFGSPFLFAMGLIIELILMIVLVFALIKALRTPLKILGSIILSAWSGILTNPYVKRVQNSQSLIFRWLVARLNPKKPTGLILTIGIVISFIFFLNFSRVLHDVWFHGPLTRTDTRVINLMPSIRTPLQTNFFRFVTMTAEIQSIVLLVALSGLTLWAKKKRFAAILFVVALVIEESSTCILKQIVRRTRPAQFLSLVKEGSFSFPSGHVLRATVIFGLLSYLLFRSFKSTLLRLGIILFYVVGVTLVAISRVYLGVHYPTDVLASVLFGATLLTLLITLIEITTRFKIWQQNVRSFNCKMLAAVPPITIIFALVAAPFFVQIRHVEAATTYKCLPTINQDTLKELPLYSETLSGKTMEPINFIYIGSGRQIEQLFLSHGWYKADPSTLANTLKALSVGFQGRQYQNAPVTPSYLNARPETLAFEKPTDSNTLRQRHHTRLWKTDFKTTKGQEIWVATASYDEGIEFAGPAKLPTHHIDPNVDAERSYIVDSLGLKNIQYLQLVNPQAGKNASGDLFFTDGKAAIIQL